MVNISSSIAFIFAVIIIWTGSLLITYLAIKHRLKKQKEQEPFFQLPLYKKIFFLGFEEKALRLITILSFCINLLFIILFVAAFWNIIDANITTSYIIRFGGLIFLVLVLLRQFSVYKKI